MKWQRYEHKYLLDEALARRVIRSLTGYLKPDTFAARFPGNTYAISSLYLDAPDLRLYRESVDGIERRFKLRVRSYSDDPSTPLHFEIKRRLNGIVHKTRCAIPRAIGYELLETRRLPEVELTPSERHALLEFLTLMTRIGARPQVLVRYDREAYEGRFDPKVRVTFDRRLRTARAHDFRVEVQREDFLEVRESRVVLEFKFDGLVPSWIHAVVQRFELERLSFSKYGHSIRRAQQHAASW